SGARIRTNSPREAEPLRSSPQGWHQRPVPWIGWKQEGCCPWALTGEGSGLRPIRQRSGGGLGAGFSTASMATRLTLVIAGLSILAVIFQRAVPGLVGDHLLFTPSRVVHLELWQVVTYALVVPLSGAGIFY